MPFNVGCMFAWIFGYRDAVSITTIGAGAVTYIVGPVTGAPLVRVLRSWRYQLQRAW